MSRHRRHTTRRFWILIVVAALAAAGVVWLAHTPSQHHPSPHHPRNPAPSHRTARREAVQFGSWTTAPVLLVQPMVGFATVAAAHTLWILGGLINDQSTRLIQRLRFDSAGRPATMTAAAATLPVPLHDLAAVPWNGSLLLLGGGSFVSSARVYQMPIPQLAPASVANPLPQPLSDLSAVPLGSRVLIIGGHDSGAPSATIWSYAPYQPAHVWAHLPVGVRYAAVAHDNATLYAVGGLTAANSYSTQAVSFNLRTGHMTSLPPYPLAVQYAEAVVIHHVLLVAGGETRAGWTRAAYWYDAAQHVWRPAPALPAARGYGALVNTPDGGAAWLGGEGPTGASRTIWTIDAH